MRGKVCICLLLAGLIFAGSVWGDPGPAVYLKWERELFPRQEGGHWVTGARDLDALLAGYSLEKVSRVIQFRKDFDPAGLKLVLRLDMTSLEDRSDLINALRRLPGTIYAVENPERHTCQLPGKEPPERQILEVPNDPLYPQQWFYPVMHAPAAWDVAKGSGVVVAIVDIGTDWQHPDLMDNIWHNPGEIPDNGIDDDGNGYVDDYIGWDFYGNDNNPAPANSQDSHGTHTAGLVAAVMNNNRGVVGMAPSSKIMAVRAGSAGIINYGTEGVIYAVNNGANIISLSWGGSGYNSFEGDVYTDAEAQGSLVVAAAGNETSSSPHYPAGYAGVLSVGATDPTDHKADFSNYGSWVRVSAPGTAILSLGVQSYVTYEGTSMSTPIVAGVAALVKSSHTDWTNDQVMSQVIYTADPIDSLNPAFAGLMGSGRVNAYRAVTETAPGIDISALDVVEQQGNMNGRLESGETGALILSLINHGASTSNVHVTLSSNNANLQVQQANWTIPQMAAGQTLTNAADPFTVHVSASAGPNVFAGLIFAVSAENFYHANLTYNIWINPTFADHDTGNVRFTLTDFGAFGYRNYVAPTNPPPGSGFRFPKTGSSALYHGSLIAGVSTTKVSDCAYGEFGHPRYDWVKIPGGDLIIRPDTVADQVGNAIYQDTGSPPAGQCSLRVTQKSYAWTAPPNDEYVIVAFTLINVSSSLKNDLYVGLYMDWDVAVAEINKVGWDPANQLGYQWNSAVQPLNPRYYGISLLTGTAASYRAIDLANDLVNYTMSDSQKYVFMSSGMVKTAGPTPSDYAMLMSAGPYSLPPGDSVQVAFAVLGGADLNHLKSNAQAAHAQWATVTTGGKLVEPAPQADFRITGTYPQPANGEMAINFTLPGSGKVSFELVDVLGRIVPLWEGNCPQAGPYHITLPRRELASGVYLLRGTSPFGKTSTKIVWIK